VGYVSEDDILYTRHFIITDYLSFTSGVHKSRVPVAIACLRWVIISVGWQYGTLCHLSEA